MELTIKNIHSQPYGARTSKGVAILAPGETFTADFDDGEAKNILANSAVFQEVKSASPAKVDEPAVSLSDAVNALDHKDDTHWTQGGKPNLEHLAKVTGSEVKRADVDALNVVRKT